MQCGWSGINVCDICQSIRLDFSELSRNTNDDRSRFDRPRNIAETWSNMFLRLSFPGLFSSNGRVYSCGIVLSSNSRSGVILVANRRKSWIPSSIISIIASHWRICFLVSVMRVSILSHSSTCAVAESILSCNSLRCSCNFTAFSRRTVLVLPFSLRRAKVGTEVFGVVSSVRSCLYMAFDSSVMLAFENPIFGFPPHGLSSSHVKQSRPLIFCS